jgi:hypothetical protein
MGKNENKTRPTAQNVADFIASLPEKQRVDAQTLIDIMQEISGQPPIHWGGKIIGFGSYHYKYASGREGDAPQIGFAPGTGKFSLYLSYNTQELVSKFPNLGKFKTSKACIYINKLADVDLAVLKQLIETAYAEQRSS